MVYDRTTFAYFSGSFGLPGSPAFKNGTATMSFNNTALAPPEHRTMNIACRISPVVDKGWGPWQLQPSFNWNDEAPLYAPSKVPAYGPPFTTDHCSWKEFKESAYFICCWGAQEVTEFPNYTYLVNTLPVGNGGSPSRGTYQAEGSLLDCAGECDANASCLGFSTGRPHNGLGACWLFDKVPSLTPIGSFAHAYYQKQGTPALRPESRDVQ